MTFRTYFALLRYDLAAEPWAVLWLITLISFDVWRFVELSA